MESPSIEFEMESPSLEVEMESPSIGTEPDSLREPLYYNDLEPLHKSLTALELHSS